MFVPSVGIKHWLLATQLQRYNTWNIPHSLNFLDRSQQQVQFDM